MRLVLLMGGANLPDGTSQADFDRAHNELDDERCAHGVSIYECCLECWPEEQELEES